MYTIYISMERKEYHRRNSLGGMYFADFILSSTSSEPLIFDQMVGDIEALAKSP